MVRRPIVLAALVGLMVATGVAVAFAAFSKQRRYQTTYGSKVERFKVASQLLRRRLAGVAVVPPGKTRGRPLLIMLHGRAMPPDGLLSKELFKALRRLGRRAPIIFFPNGGDHSYYHDRRDGSWGGYLLGEAIPAAIARFHADPRRLAIGGVSMGGFGALDLARIAPGRFCAVGAHSAALWEHAMETAPGAFDNAADFGRHDLFAYVGSNRRPYGRTPVWLDVGTHDPFWRVDNRLAQLLRRRGARAQFHVWDGSHSTRYWDAHMPSYLQFYALELARCSTGSQ
ncbi:MAG: esterase family protein [Actinomycetota bacterium]|nr:esterase family protein [Actinomycetota bacterium]